MSRLWQKLAQGAFVVTAEIDPPRGPDASRMLDKARDLARLVDAVNVTDCPMANIRMNAIVAAHLIEREAGVETIFHFTCRDRNLIGVQADLLGAAGLGLRHVLVLTGDPPERGNQPDAKPVFDIDTPGLVRLVKDLNGGATRAGVSLEGPTGFFAVVAANPGSSDLEREAARLAEKVAAGAHFVQTQPVFDAETVERFQEALDRQGLKVPILYGIMPLKSREMARRMAAIPGIRIPQAVLQRVEEGPEGEGLSLAAELAASLYGRAAGVHIFPMGSVPAVMAIAEALAARRSCA